MKPDIFLFCTCSPSGEPMAHEGGNYELKTGSETGTTQAGPYSIWFRVYYRCKNCGNKTHFDLKTPEMVRMANITQDGKVRKP